MSLPPFLSLRNGVLTLAIKLQPRAARNEIVGQQGAELRVRVTAPPVDAAANEALLRLLAELLDCPRRQLELLRGHASRHKLVALRGVDPEEALRRFSG
jgi:hypothetical protein